MSQEWCEGGYGTLYIILETVSEQNVLELLFIVQGKNQWSSLSQHITFFYHWPEIICRPIILQFIQYAQKKFKCQYKSTCTLHNLHCCFVELHLFCAWGILPIHKNSLKPNCLENLFFNFCACLRLYSPTESK